MLLIEFEQVGADGATAESIAVNPAFIPLVEPGRSMRVRKHGGPVLPKAPERGPYATVPGGFVAVSDEETHVDTTTVWVASSAGGGMARPVHVLGAFAAVVARLRGAGLRADLPLPGCTAQDPRGGLL